MKFLYDMGNYTRKLNINNRDNNYYRNGILYDAETYYLKDDIELPDLPTKIVITQNDYPNNICSYQWGIKTKFSFGTSAEFAFVPHRDRQPAILTTTAEGLIIEISYQQFGLQHSTDGPAFINNRNGLYKWFINGIYQKDITDFCLENNFNINPTPDEIMILKLAFPILNR